MEATCGIKLAAIAVTVKIPKRPTCRLIQVTWVSWVSTEKAAESGDLRGPAAEAKSPKLGLDASDPTCSPRQVIASVADSVTTAF